ncbi:integrase [Bradyrhizobium japonicum]|uniref:tyrosine-type recombinase/integrase n=1 Tax=Bradyrhizobium TaxID=374 RepID=UPI0004AE3595|nr:MULTISPECIES: tyrosine-type recombinase/integrase [Bradyrhizobium]MDI2076511.1 tyrosine-type recombinase/integrase [Bradyrhizobium sp. Mp27]
MARRRIRKVNHFKLDTPSARQDLPVRRKPYNGPRLARGVLLQYRRNQFDGSWVLKTCIGGNRYSAKAIGQADDFSESDGKKILTYVQAQGVARKLVTGSADEDGEINTGAMITVRQALTKYKLDLISRHASPYNATTVLKHLPDALLNKQVALLESSELTDWRNGLLDDDLKASSINRYSKSLCAALELARGNDPARIRNRDAWETGLARLPNAQKARNVVLPDHRIHVFVAAAYAKNPRLGLYVDTLAGTGARPSQASRLRVEDLHYHPTKPKLMMPKAGKGGGRTRAERKHEHFSVPISVALAKRLKAAAAGRDDDAPLLLRTDDQDWGDRPSQNYRDDVREIFTAMGEDASKMTLYCLRHSSITRMILKRLPLKLIAGLHNTSISEVERTYAKFITETEIDAMTRAGLLDEPEPEPMPVLEAAE